MRDRLPKAESILGTGMSQNLSRGRRHACDLASLAGWGGGRVDSEGDYVWNLWRPYKCCQRKGQWFLFDIDWIAYP